MEKMARPVYDLDTEPSRAAGMMMAAMPETRTSNRALSGSMTYSIPRTAGQPPMV